MVGWACAEGGTRPSRIRIDIDGLPACYFMPVDYREDLEHHQAADGFCGIAVDFPRPLAVWAPVTVEVYDDETSLSIWGPELVSPPDRENAVVDEPQLGERVTRWTAESLMPSAAISAPGGPMQLAALCAAESQSRAAAELAQFVAKLQYMLADEALSEIRRLRSQRKEMQEGSTLAEEKGEIVIDFRAGGNLADFRHSGFSYAEGEGCWSVGTESSLVLPQPGVQREKLILSATLLPCILEGHVAEQHLTIEVNGIVVYDGSVHGRTIVEVPVPSAMATAEPDLSLVFRHPDAVAPATIGSSDTRPLAFFFDQLSVRRRPEPSDF
jgi:hypothetical protein